MKHDPKIAVLGAGNLGGAFIEGLLQNRSTTRGRLHATTRSPQHAAALTTKYGVSVSSGNNAEVTSCADLVILGVKPTQIAEVIHDINPALRPSHILVSMIASIPLERIEQLLAREIAVFRIMPNLAMSVRESVTAICANQRATHQQRLLVERIFKNVGAVMPISEHLMHAFTALGASGPGFICAVVEAMVKAGAKLGLPESLSIQVCKQTFTGTIKLLNEPKMSPAALQKSVTTPGGITAAGVEQLTKHRLPDAFISALEAATQKSKAATNELT